MTTSSPFIASPAAPASPAGSIFPGDGWWPDIDFNAMREALRVGEVVAQPRLEATLENAVITVSDDLRRWRAAREAEGFTSLATVAPTDIINGKPRLVVLFTGAVRYAAAAELAELSTDFSATANDETRADAKRELRCYYERLRMNNVRSILNVTRVAVELI